jgi:hypothetical protein
MSGTGMAVARAICSAFSYGRIEDAKQLSSMFSDETEFEAALAKVISEVVGLSNWELLIDA